jgi:hypothetical protein
MLHRWIKKPSLGLTVMLVSGAGGENSRYSLPKKKKLNQCKQN